MLQKFNTEAPSVFRLTIALLDQQVFECDLPCMSVLERNRKKPVELTMSIMYWAY